MKAYWCIPFVFLSIPSLWTLLELSIIRHFLIDSMGPYSEKNVTNSDELITPCVFPSGSSITHLIIIDFVMAGHHQLDSALHRILATRPMHYTVAWTWEGVSRRKELFSLKSSVYAGPAVLCGRAWSSISGRNFKIFYFYDPCLSETTGKGIIFYMTYIIILSMPAIDPGWRSFRFYQRSIGVYFATEAVLLLPGYHSVDPLYRGRRSD